MVMGYVEVLIVLNNLLYNTVKFTSHLSQKPGFSTSVQSFPTPAFTFEETKITK